MSRLNDLLRQVANSDPQLAKDLRRETDALADRRAFGLNFERHTPEAVELPGRPVRKSDKVRILPERGKMPTKEDERLFRVTKVYSEGGDRWADVTAVDSPHDAWSVNVDDLIVVAEFRDPIYPGLVSSGKVEQGGDKPYHIVINSENYHALQALLFTHRGKIDCIYIDPPYNTGARDWKYNNDYVASDDHYRHSKWLAFMERRLLLGKELLADDGALVVTIDEHEVHRLALLVEQIMTGFTVQMVTIVNNPKGVTQGYLSRVEEYAIFCFAPNFKMPTVPDDLLTHKEVSETADGRIRPRWKGLLRSGDDSRREDREHMFYPVWLDPNTRRLIRAGDYLPLGESPNFQLKDRQGNAVAWPVRKDGSLGRWGVGTDTLNKLIEQGFASCGRFDKKRSTWGISYLSENVRAELADGLLEVLARDEVTGVADVVYVDTASRRARTVWHRSSHDAGAHGTDLLGDFLGSGRSFPFPKSLYAVEDTVRLLVARKPHAVVLDFFAGSGTTAHAVMRLNRQDGGQRVSISVSNNEVSPDRQIELRAEGARPGDPIWESNGLCESITKSRVRAALQGQTPEGRAVEGLYKFVDEFPKCEGFSENAEFFTLTYESAMRVASNREFAKIAPFLWLRAGARGRRIDDISAGWDVADTYGVIANLDLSEPFIKTVEAQEGLTHAFIATDEDRLFEAMVRLLPEHVEPVRLYSSYLRTFEIEAGRAAR
ncbi:site-specific DNA-methyltransferase [Gordonia alkanivorans]|uniref:Putative DNA methyltransferase n=1 Tax=Gordonia alkanivorans NBRC 16433 TaxID=1027371 RepID=F9W075_9ACTN|nr:DNA methyltransferase [Gordonia alkanivorans]GAA14264.1 putative DNA methyltransferase [Gordonia alkanivorans NBRC 16433]